MTFVSYAQNFEDVLLRRAFRDVAQGFYIDVGAAHPDTDSVTRAFYDRGWHGVNIEPVPELHGRLSAARPRDVNLRVAVGDAETEGTLYVVAGTGLSTIDPALAEQHRAQSFDVRAQDVPCLTLAAICRRHAPEIIHFLKIDVEGAERAVLSGADFSRFRPWIVLVEATAPGSAVQTHETWESLLVDRHYRFLYFDGLNRFYAAEEQSNLLAPHFQVPVCVFDEFVRAADSEWVRRISHAEMQAADLLERSMVAEAGIAAADARAQETALLARDADIRAHNADRRAHDSELRARAAEQRAETAEARAQQAEPRALGAERRADAAEQRLQQTEARLGTEAAEAGRLRTALRLAETDAASLRRSTSWRLTAPLRGGVRAARATAVLLSRRLRPGRLAPAPAPVALPPAAPRRLAAAPPLQPALDTLPVRIGPEHGGAVRNPARAVHQFHSGSAVGDAITNAMLLIRARLRALGYRSEIYVEHLDPGLADELRPLDDMPLAGDDVLIWHLSMGFDAYDRVLALPSRKVLLYHNITPAWLFEGQPDIQHYAALGRRQLAGLRGQVAAALADSEYNASELRRLGFEDPQACTLLFDLDALRRRGPAETGDANRPFTLLFVGRMVASKGQRDLVEAFARFRAYGTGSSRLVLIGREDGIGAAYAQAVRARVRELDLDSAVHIMGLVPDEVLHAQYRQADLYVSLSRHEGFGVPLVEAASIGVPVLAWPAGAVAFTLGPAGLLDTRAPDGVAAQLARLAADPEARARIAGVQARALVRFDLADQLATLSAALARAGAAPPADPRARAALAGNLRFTVTGHVNGSYSLASINRILARALDGARPGHVRMVPVEGVATARLDGVPAEEGAGIQALVEHGPHETGPEVVISQHYPLYVPPEPGDALLAYLFWEESLLPAPMVATLNAAFRGVLAPSRTVAKALVDSGVSIPVRVVGLAPELKSLAALAAPRDATPGLTRFLHISSAFPRKGADVLLAAYAKAFRAGDPVRLVLKTFPNPHNDVVAQLAALRAGDPDAPAIELIDRDLEAPAMAALLADADAMVLPTRGEGFNLPAAEAMAAGVPLIVTGAGGHMDFCGPDTARLIAWRPQLSRSHVASPLSLWAEPDVDDLAAALREVYDDPAAAKARAARGRAKAEVAFDRRAFIDRVEAAALDVLLAPPTRPLRLCIVSSWGVRCGIAEYTANLIDALLAARPDMDITVLSDTRTERRQAGIRPRVRPVWTLGGADAPGLLRRAASSTDAEAVLIEHQPGLFGWGVLGAVLEALEPARRVIVVTLHNTASLRDVSPAEVDAALAGLAQAARVTVHSLADLERLRAMGLTENVALIPHGGPEPPPARPERTLLPDSTVTLGSCGFLLPGKGLPALVEAAGLLVARRPKLRLRLLNADYGDDGSRAEAERVRAAIQAAGLGQAVHLVTDFLPAGELSWRLSQCDLIVLPYPGSKEGASGALRMALGAGPCVAVTPIDFFHEAGDAVWRLPGTDAASMARGIETLLADQDLRSVTRAAARDWLAEREWSAVGLRMAGLLTGLAVAIPRAA